MAKFQVGDLVKISGVSYMTPYTGRIIALEEPNRIQMYYVVQISQTGLIRSFPELHLVLIQASESHSA